MPKRRSSTVRSHTRRLSTGRVVRVRRHARRVTLGERAMTLLNRSHRPPRSGRAVMSFRSGARTLRHAGRALRRKRHGRAIGLATFGALEIVGWLAFRTTGLVIATVVAVLSTVAMLLLSRTTGDAPNSPATIQRRAGIAPAPAARRVNKAIK